MKILIGCEESQAVTIEFRKLGFTAYSCDIQKCSGKYPNWHIQKNIFDVLDNDKWDVLIAFPPCTHLSNAGAQYFEQKRLDGRQQQAVNFFMNLWQYPIKHICLENPVGYINTHHVKPSQIIQPYYFGDNEQKTTCLWLKNLPKLVHIKQDDLFDKKTHVPKPQPKKIYKSGKRGYFVETNNGSKNRSKTFPSIAQAMANQWGKFLKEKTESQKRFGLTNELEKQIHFLSQQK